MPGVRPSWLLDRDDNLTLLDEEVAAALQDETVRAVLREVMGLPERERKIGWYRASVRRVGVRVARAMRKDARAAPPQQEPSPHCTPSV